MWVLVSPDQFCCLGAGVVGFEGGGDFVFGASVEDFYFGIAFEEVDCGDDAFDFR